MFQADSLAASAAFLGGLPAMLAVSAVEAGTTYPTESGADPNLVD